MRSRRVLEAEVLDANWSEDSLWTVFLVIIHMNRGPAGTLVAAPVPNEDDGDGDAVMNEEVPEAERLAQFQKEFDLLCTKYNLPTQLVLQQILKRASGLSPLLSILTHFYQKWLCMPPWFRWLMLSTPLHNQLVLEREKLTQKLLLLM